MSSNAATASLPDSLRRGAGMSWPLLVGLAAFLLPMVMGYGLEDGDTYLHIAAGQWMLAHAHVMTQDPFSFTRLGAPATAQEWGSDLLIAATFRAAGWSGLVALSAICFATTLAYLMRFLQSRMEPLHALVLGLLAAWMMMPSLFARPHTLVWPLTAVWVGTLVHCGEENRAPPWWLLGVLLLWVNMHGSFILAPGLAVLLAADAVVRAREGRWGIAKRWLPFIAAAIGCMFVNPQGYRLVLFPFRLLAMKDALALIREWQPPNFDQPEVLGVWIIAIVGLAFMGRIRLPVVRAITVLGLFYMALQHGRNVALLGLISPFFLAAPLAELWRQTPVPGRDAGAIDRGFRALASPARGSTVVVTVVFAAVIGVVALNWRKPLPPIFARPSGALDVVLARAPGERILNDPIFGDYLIYRGVPDFMDDRADVYGDAFILQTERALSLAPGSDLPALLSQYRIGAILLGTECPAVQLLDRLPGWQRVYSDKVAVAYVRRESRKS